MKTIKLTGFYAPAVLLVLTGAMPNTLVSKCENMPLVAIRSNVQNTKAHIQTCKSIIAQVEAQYNIPKHLLSAIANVESRGRPWTVWARGKGHYFANHTQAKNFVQQQRNKGNSQMFLGCMQICMKTHGHQFSSAADALDPYQNIRFAAQLLKRLHKRYGNWEDAVMYYNASSNMESYKDKVFRVWNKQKSL
jgi:soluble lytic murein transglycosylase-like protein